MTIKDANIYLSVFVCGIVLPGSASLGQISNPAPAQIVWGVKLGTAYVDTSPAISHQDGTIFVGGWNGKLYAITPEGKIKWAFPTKGDIKSTPAIDTAGRIYFGSRDKHLYCISSKGRLVWKFRTGGWVDSSPALSTSGEVLFGSWDKKFYCLSTNGTKQWEFMTAGPIVSSPAIDKQGTVYFGSHDSNFYALTLNGKLKWLVPTGGPIISSPAIAGDDTIYFTSVDGNLYALNPDGSLKWKLWTGGFTESSPVIDRVGDLYICITNALAKISSEGTIVWVRRLGTLLADTTPAVLANDAVCVYGPEGTFSCHSSLDGNSIWRIWMYGPGTASSPAVTPDGRIYVGNIHTNFLALATTNRPGNSAWPLFKRNLRRTGNAVDLE